MPTTSDTALGRKLLAGAQAASKKNVDDVKTSSPSLSSSSSSSTNKPNKPDPPSPFWTDWEASVDYVSSNLPEEEWVVLDEQLGLLSLSSSSPPFQTTIKSPTDTSTTGVETSPSTVKAESLNEASSIKVPSIQLCVKDAARASFKSSRGANRRPSTTQGPSPSSSSAVKKSSPPTRTTLSKKTTKASSNAIKEDVVSKNAKAAPRPHSALSRPPKVKVDKNNLIQVLEEESSSKKLSEPKALLPLLTNTTGSKNYSVPTDNKENNGAGGRGRAPAAAHVASKNHRRRHQHGPPSAPSTKLERQQQDHHYPPRYDSMLQHYHKLQQLNQELRSCVTLVE